MEASTVREFDVAAPIHAIYWLLEDQALKFIVLLSSKVHRAKLTDVDEGHEVDEAFADFIVSLKRIEVQCLREYRDHDLHKADEEGESGRNKQFRVIVAEFDKLEAFCIFRDENQMQSD